LERALVNVTPQEPAGHGTKPAGHDTPMTATYISVLIVEAAIVVGLWLFGKMFS
jgi:hypothetical protein